MPWHGRLARPDLRIPITATHPTRPTHPKERRNCSWLTPSLWLPVDEHCALRNETVVKEAPQRNGQLARNRNDHDPSHTAALPCGSLHKPASDRALWPVLEPEPSGLDHGPAYLASSGSRDSRDRSTSPLS